MIEIYVRVQKEEQHKALFHWIVQYILVFNYIEVVRGKRIKLPDDVMSIFKKKQAQKPILVRRHTEFHSICLYV